MVEVRCKECGRLLGFFDGKGNVKCTKSECRAVNEFDTHTGEVKVVNNQKTKAQVWKQKSNHVKMKDRTTSSGLTFR